MIVCGKLASKIVLTTRPFLSSGGIEGAAVFLNHSGRWVSHSIPFLTVHVLRTGCEARHRALCHHAELQGWPSLSRLGFERVGNSALGFFRSTLRLADH